MGSVDKEEKGSRAATKDVPTYRGREEENKPSKGRRGSFQELARTPRGFVVTEAPTKLSVGLCDMVTIW